LRGPATKQEDAAYVAIVTAGRCRVTAGGETHRLHLYDKFFCPAGLGPVEFTPDPVATLLECYPPAS
jgi:mannose-6-phosphate isomerase